MKKLFTLFSALFVAGSAFAQIPNPSFENWTAVGAYDSAWSWGTPNYATGSFSVYCAEKGTTTPPSGSAFLKLTSKTLIATSVAPGIAISGKLNIVGTTYSISGGFPYTTRSASLTGSWQYMASGADQGHIATFLWKWNVALNKRDTVAFTDNLLTGMVMSWATFTIPLTYYSGATPDSGLIILSASGTTPVANSYLYVDNLAFTGSVPSSVVTISHTASETSLYPNPAAYGKTTLFCSRNGSSKMSIVVTDLNGKVIKEMTTKTQHGVNEFQIDLSGIAQGIYFVRASDDEVTETKKLIIE